MFPRLHIGVALFLTIFGISGCACNQSALLDAVWKKPEYSLNYRSDGEGPYPKEWPTEALLINPYGEIDSPRTIAFFVGEGLADASMLSDACKFLRFAQEASPQASGKWVRLNTSPVFMDDVHTVFFLWEPRRLRAFSQHVSFHAGFQEHVFCVILDTTSWGHPLLLDIDHDDSLELLVDTEGPLEGKNEAVYTVFDYQSNTLAAVSNINSSTVQDAIERQGQPL